MASGQDVNINTQQELKLIESHIPGAELPRPAEDCTVAILQHSLACRGGKGIRKTGGFDEKVRRSWHVEHRVVPTILHCI